MDFKAWKRRRRVFKVILLILLTFCAFFIIWYMQPYRADRVAQAAMSGSTEIPVSRQKDYVAFLPVASNASAAADIGVILYPGGLVEYEAYAPLAAELAKRNYPVYLVRMPLNLAVLDINRADRIIGDLAADPQAPDRFVIGGHSLGGSMAAYYCKRHADRVCGLFLLGSYSTVDLSQSGLSVISLRGDLDGLTSQEDIDRHKENLPADTRFVTIAGGNHAQFGSYGSQSGDRTAQLAAAEQWQQTADELAVWLQQIPAA